MFITSDTVIVWRGIIGTYGALRIFMDCNDCYSVATDIQLLQFYLSYDK